MKLDLENVLYVRLWGGGGGGGTFQYVYEEITNASIIGFNTVLFHLTESWH